MALPSLPSLHCLPSLAQIALFTENIFQVGASKRQEDPIISFPSIWMPGMFLGVACLRGEDNANADVRLKAEGAALVPTWHLAVSRAETWLGKK